MSTGNPMGPLDRVVHYGNRFFNRQKFKPNKADPHMLTGISSPEGMTYTFETPIRFNPGMEITIDTAKLTATIDGKTVKLKAARTPEQELLDSGGHNGIA